MNGILQLRRLARTITEEILNATFRCAAVTAAMALYVLSWVSPLAAANDIFSVSGVAVTVEGDPQSARDRAYMAGQMLAWQKLVVQLVGHTDFAFPNETELASWIRDFDVEEEKVTAKAYNGHFTYRFAADPVRNFFHARNIAFAEPTGRPLIVIPLMIDETGGAYLWEKQNLWANAWRNQHGSLAPILVPRGTPEDVQMLTTNQVMTKDTAALRTISNRYRAIGVILATATIKTTDTAQPSLKITATRLGSGQTQRMEIDLPLDQANVDLAMANGVQSITESLNTTWRQANLVDQSQNQSMQVRVYLSDLSGWLDLQQRLNSVPNLRNRQLQMFSRREALMMLTFAGSPQQIASTLNNVGLSVAPTATGESILEIAASWDLPTEQPNNGAAPPSLPLPTQP